MARNRQHGYSLMELLIALAIGVAVLAAALQVAKFAMDNSAGVVRRGDMQANARAALGMMSQDLMQAGTQVMPGGIGLPSGTGSGNSLAACDGIQCYIANNNYPGQRLYMVTPRPASGPAISGINTDSITIVYVDPTFNLNKCPAPSNADAPLQSVTPSGSQITVASCVNLGDTANGVHTGDVIMIWNANGSAVGVATNVIAASGKIDFANSDPLNFNQPSAANGNIASLQSGKPASYPSPTYAARLLVVSYYIRVNPGPDGKTGTADDSYTLMRQVNANTPQPVAENVDNLQITYDIFDENAGAGLSGSKTAGTPSAPNQIKTVNVAVTVRSSQINPNTQNYDRITLATSVSPRNLSFHDRYQ